MSATKKEVFPLFGFSKKYYYEKAFWFSIAVIWGLMSMYFDETYYLSDYIIELILVIIMIAGVLSITSYTKKLALKFYDVHEDEIKTDLTYDDPGFEKTLKYNVATLLVFFKVIFCYVGLILMIYRYTLTNQLFIVLHKSIYHVSSVYYNFWLLQTTGYIICIPIIIIALIIKKHIGVNIDNNNIDTNNDN